MTQLPSEAMTPWEREIDRRKFLRSALLSVGGITVLGAAACGPNSGSAAPRGSKGASSGAASGSSAQGVLAAAYERPILSLDPHSSDDVDEGTLLASRAIYDSLVVRQGDQIAPSLASSWSQPDPLTWVFKLRNGVTFHDGTPFTASDVKASLERLASSHTPQAPLWASLDSVTAVDPHTVQIKTKTPSGTILSNLTLLFIPPAAKLSEAGFFDNPIGTGPFQVVSFTSSDHLNLAAAKGYWGGAPKLAKLNFPYIPESATRLTSLETGQVDVTWEIPPDQLTTLKSQSGLQVQTVPSYTYYFNWFNCSRAPFTDPRVRQAMWHAIDMNTIVSSLFGKTADVMNAPIPPTVFGYAAQSPYDYNPTKAKQLLAAAGHPNGFSSTMMWANGMTSEIASLAQAFQSYWQKIGVTVQLQQLEQASWLKKLLALDWDMDLQTNGVTTGDADYVLGRLYTTKAHRLGYSNPALDSVLAQAQSSTDQATRKSLYAKACKIIWDDAPGIYPAQLNATYGVRNSVKGFVPSPSDQPVFGTVSKS